MKFYLTAILILIGTQYSMAQRDLNGDDVINIFDALGIGMNYGLEPIYTEPSAGHMDLWFDNEGNQLLYLTMEENWVNLGQFDIEKDEVLNSADWEVIEEGFVPVEWDKYPSNQPVNLSDIKFEMKNTLQDVTNRYCTLRVAFTADLPPATAFELLGCVMLRGEVSSNELPMDSMWAEFPSSVNTNDVEMLDKFYPNITLSNPDHCPGFDLIENPLEIGFFHTAGGQTLYDGDGVIDCVIIYDTDDLAPALYADDDHQLSIEQANFPVQVQARIEDKLVTFPIDCFTNSACLTCEGELGDATIITTRNFVSVRTSLEESNFLPGDPTESGSGPQPPAPEQEVWPENEEEGCLGIALTRFEIIRLSDDRVVYTDYSTKITPRFRWNYRKRDMEEGTYQVRVTSGSMQTVSQRFKIPFKRKPSIKTKPFLN